MRAIQFDTYGEPADVLRTRDVDDLHAGAGQIRIRVAVAGVNPVDWKVVTGAMAGGASTPEAPQTAGGDVAGVVDEVGEGVRDVAVGDEVFGYALTGGLAQQALLEQYAKKPAGVTLEESAALPVPVETALRVLDALDLQEGQTLLVDGASGAVGIAAVQVALSLGATVLGTASEANHEFVASLGATPTTYGEGLVERVRELAPQGVDKALDTAGKGSVPDLVTLTGDPGDVVTIADFSAADLGVQVSTGGGDRVPRLRRAAELAAEGTVSVPVQQVYGFDDALAAYAESQGGHVRGKLIVRVD